MLNSALVEKASPCRMLLNCINIEKLFNNKRFTDNSRRNIAAKYFSRHVPLLPLAVESGVVVEAELGGLAPHLHQLVVSQLAMGLTPL
jgi:hypothetical protein